MASPFEGINAPTVHSLPFLPRPLPFSSLPSLSLPLPLPFPSLPFPSFSIQLDGGILAVRRKVAETATLPPTLFFGLRKRKTY